ncbi:MAG: hypothetical protein NT013_23395 [Planctomycetia bacterium]|nr:hypothetical protein [Planctomycetia bacterium]
MLKRQTNESPDNNFAAFFDWMPNLPKCCLNRSPPEFACNRPAQRQLLVMSSQMTMSYQTQTGRDAGVVVA